MERKTKQRSRYRRHRRVRSRVFGTAARPRLCVFRSTKHIQAQLIDDEKRKTLVSASDLELKGKRKKPAPYRNEVSGAGEKPKTKEAKVIRTGKVAIAYEVGKLIAKRALEKKIEKVVFDRGGYKYHGRVKALAQGAREAGLNF